MDLYWKLVKAGYVEKGVSTTPAEVGVPALAGSLVSPLLSNIYLSELDRFMEGYIEVNSSKSHLISKVNPKMANLTKKIRALHKKLEVDRSATLKERATRQYRNTLPSRIRTGVRIHYVRYADD